MLWEEIHFYYSKYAKRAGFIVVKDELKKKQKNRCVNYIILACIRQGKPRKGKSNALKPVPKIIRMECNAEICAMLSVDGTWFFSKVMLKHNHDLSPNKARFF